MRKDGKTLNYPVSIVTDYDVRPKEDWTFDDVEEKNKLNGINAKLDSNDNTNVKLFLATHWTLEWCLFMSNALSAIFKEACMNVHSKTDEFKKTPGGDFDDEKFRSKLAEKQKKQFAGCEISGKKLGIIGLGFFLLITACSSVRRNRFVLRLLQISGGLVFVRCRT